MRTIPALILAGALLLAAGCAKLDTGSPKIPAEPFALIVLPDTQLYARDFPDTFTAQTQWIADNAAAMNIQYVLHLGDVTQDNVAPHWTVAQTAFGHLDGKVPYAICLGNHDLGPDGRAIGRESMFGEFFPLSKFQSWPTFGGVYDKEPDRPDNSWHRFAAGGRKWLVLALEFAPRDDVLRWANDVVAAHQDSRVIVITHAYLFTNGQRYDRTVKGQAHRPSGYGIGGLGNDGQQMWDKLIAPNENVRMVISGHVCYTARRADPNKAGKVVHQMVVDYQKAPRGGDGYLRILRFSADGNTVDVEDYSVTLKKSHPSANTKFRLSFEEAKPAR